MQLRLAFTLGVSSIAWSHVFGSGSLLKFSFSNKSAKSLHHSGTISSNVLASFPSLALGGEVIRMISAYEDSLCKVYRREWFLPLPAPRPICRRESASGNVNGDFQHWHRANVSPPDFQLMIGLCWVSQSWPKNICLSPSSVTAKSIRSA